MEQLVVRINGSTGAVIGRYNYQFSPYNDYVAHMSDIPTPDGTTITSNNGVWSAVGGGGGASLPTDPAADGTYFLSNTISSGVSTKAWVSIPAASGNNF